MIIPLSGVAAERRQELPATSTQQQHQNYDHQDQYNGPHTEYIVSSTSNFLADFVLYILYLFLSLPPSLLGLPLNLVIDTLDLGILVTSQLASLLLQLTLHLLTTTCPFVLRLPYHSSISLLLVEIQLPSQSAVGIFMRGMPVWQRIFMRSRTPIWVV